MIKSGGSHFAPDNWINGLYLLSDKLGEGGFGIVRRATHMATGENVAIKIMNKAKLGKDLQHIYQEIGTMKDLMHQNICRLYQVVETRREIFLVLEYCEQGEMFDYIVTKNKLPEPEARHFFRQLVAAMAYTHRQGYAHRDLKPENLLLKGESRYLKVIDFGLSSRTGRQLDTYCGSLCYAAPEIIMNRPYSGPAADIWSMGVLLYILVTGSAPFNAEDQRKISYSITHGLYKMPDKLTPECQDLIRGLLTVDVTKRMRMDEIMSHQWVMNGYILLKASSIYQKNIFDEDILREMARSQHRSPADLVQELKEWKFDYNTATYLANLHRKESNKSFVLPDYYTAKRSVVNSPTLHASLEKNLNMFESARNKMEAIQLFHDDTYKMTRSPKSIPYKDSAYTNKENANPVIKKPVESRIHDSGYQSNHLFVTPKRCPDTATVNQNNGNNRRAESLQRALYHQNRPTTGVQTPILRKNQQEAHPSPVTLPKTSLSSGGKSNSQQSAKCDTPPAGYADRPSRSSERSSRRPRIVASLERGSQRVFELLTPRRLRRDSSQVKVCKNYVNVSVTSSTSPEEIRGKLMQVLENLGFRVTSENWKIRGEDSRTKTSVELEVIWVETLSKIGVKRKRISGDGFQYKKICEAVLKLAGL